jgi:hypothetical protein
LARSNGVNPQGTRPENVGPLLLRGPAAKDVLS